MSHVVPLIGEAWDHRRRRRRRRGVVLLLAAAVIALLAAMLPSGTHRRAASGSTPRGPVEVAPSRVLARGPYMGVRCPIANSIACDRVGLAVWLKAPAQSVTATVAGAPLALHRRGDVLVTSDQPRREFDGFLRPAGIVSRLHVRPQNGDSVVTRHGRARVIPRHRMWYGEGHPTALVRLVIRDRSGRTMTTHLRVGLSTGWG
jgi:hypothetical protein